MAAHPMAIPAVPPSGGDAVVGITSWGDVPCVATAFCYRVDTADTLEFIDFARGIAATWLEQQTDKPGQSDGNK